jgi:FkbM family methyltransferase
MKNDSNGSRGTSRNGGTHSPETGKSAILAAVTPSDATLSDPAVATSGPGRSSRLPLSPLQRDLIEKMEMETALLAAPHDRALRAAYFDRLARFAGSRTGLSHALLPELGHPLYFRCGSTDVANMAQVFRDEVYGMPLRATPLRILDLGAYAGYAAIYLARRFPYAAITCVEPTEASFRMLTLNTTPYRRITALNLAAWHHATRLGVAARYNGDWGTQLADLLPEAERTVPAHAVSDILRMVGWDQVDLIKCDIEGSERAVFADPNLPWLHRLDTLVIETHDYIAEGCVAAVAACFDPTLFERRSHGENEVFERHVPLRMLPQLPRRELALVHNEPGLFPLALRDVSPQPWGFFTFDGNSCQLHPNQPGEKPARAVFARTLDSQTRFVATLHHAGHPAAAVVFTLRIEREDGTVVVETERALVAQERMRFEQTFPPLIGRHRIILQTAMAPEAEHNFNAWARWLEPKLS